MGREEDNQASSKGRPSNALSQAWIDTEYGEMTLLVGKEKVKFNLHQSIKLTDEEKNCCMPIKSSLQHFKGQATDFLQEETLEGIELNTNSMSTKELDLDLKLLNLDVEELILMKDEDKEGELAIKDESPKQRSRTSPMSLVGL